MTWSYTFPEQEGMDSRWIIDFLNAFEKAGSEVHGMMIVKNSSVVFEAYNEPYRRDIPHVVHSFTKCLTNTAFGILYSKGKVSLEDPVLRYFPEYEPRANEYLRQLTLKDLISMRSGQERSIGGNEWRPLKSSWIDAYFEVPFVKKGGEEFLYSSGNSYIISAVVQKITGKTCYEYLKEHLIPQIGMNEFTWSTSPEGICSGGNGASLCVEDIAKIGCLYLNHGRWNGRQIFSREWAELSFGEKKPAEGSYNFHWTHSGDQWLAGGMFGQACAVIPKLNMVVAMTAADDQNLGSSMIQKYLIEPNFSSVSLNENNRKVLQNKGQRMTLLNRYASIHEPVKGTQGIFQYRMEENVTQIKSLRLEISSEKAVFELCDHRGKHKISAGLNHWIYGDTSLTGGYLHHQYEMESLKVTACCYWYCENKLILELRYPELVFWDHISIEWLDDESIKLNRWVNMNSEASSCPEVRGMLI